MTRGKLTIISCEAGRYFGDKIFDELKALKLKNEIRIVEAKEETFANGEIKVVIDESVRGDDVYVVQCMENPHHPKSINDRLVAMFCAIDAARRAGAAFVNLVVLPYPYARQEKKKAREPITASLIANLLEHLSINSIITMDVHSDAITGFFRVTDFINLFGANNILDYLKDNHKEQLNNLVVVSPDMGGAARAKYYARMLNASLALINKERDYSKVNVVENVKLIGDVKNKNVLIVDDIIDTGGTMNGVINDIKKNGAKNIMVATSFAMMNGKCIDRFHELYEKKMLTLVLGTDAVFHNEKFFEIYPWYKEVSVASLVAKVVETINLRKAVSDVIGKR